MNQNEKAQHFNALHSNKNPLILYNIWDAGGAKALFDAGAAAVATGSWSVAAAQGYMDGEQIPLEFVLQIVARIAETVDLPLTVDFESGYATDPDELMKNVQRIISAGAVGINFEDQIIGGEKLHTINDQVARLKLIRQIADQQSLPFFINARTDIFLQSAPNQHEDLLGEAIKRGLAYAEAGASGFFIPGLTKHNLIAEICRSTSLPVNVMMMGDMMSIKKIAMLGISRASFGPKPYINSIAHLADSFQTIE